MSSNATKQGPRGEKLARTLAPGRTGPFYMQLKQDLATRINRGEFNSSGRLPSYAQLCREYSISEITARKAVSQLCDEGRVYTEKGRGIFVRKQTRPQLRLMLPYGFRGGQAQPDPAAFVLLEIYEGIRNAADRLGASIGIFSHVSRAHEQTDLNALAGLEAAEGLLFLREPGCERELDWAAREGRPYVVVEGLSEKYNRVWIDMEAGCYEMTRYLLSLGHRRIAFLTGIMSNPWYPARYRGYRRAMAEAGVPVDPALIRETGGYNPVEDDAAVSTWLSVPDLPTVILAGNDLRALHAIDYLKLRGLRVPEDISVAGYDNAPASAENDPPLTTVDAPRRQAGAEAVAELCSLIENPQRKVDKKLTPTLMIRKSVAPR